MTHKELRERTEILKAITRAVRKADEGFKTTGGSSRHWVCEQFLPCLEEGGLTIMPTAALKDAYREGVEAMRDEWIEEEGDRFAPQWAADWLLEGATPNETTREAIDEAERGEAATYYDAQTLCTLLGLDEEEKP